MRTLIFVLLMFCASASSKANYVDSLLQVAHSDVPVDTSLEAYFFIVEHYYFKDIDSCRYFAAILVQEAKEHQRPRYAAIGFHFAGLTYFNENKLNETLTHYYLALDNYILAKDSGNIASLYIGIGNLQTRLKEYQKSNEEYQKGLKWLRDSDSTYAAYLYHNIAVNYKELEKYDSAIDYYDRSLKIKEALGDSAGIALTFHNLGIIQEFQGDNNAALAYYERAFQIQKNIDNQTGIASLKPTLGKLYINLHRVKEGLQLCKESYLFYEENQQFHRSLDVCECLYEGYQVLGDYKNAFKYYKEYVSDKDSLYNYEKTRDLVQIEADYEFEKIHFADSLENAKKEQIHLSKIAKNKAELELKNKELYLLILGISALIIISFVLFNRFKTTRKQKSIIEEQKDKVDKALGELEVKNEEIMDSITYAKRIQSAILPTNSQFHSALTNAFVLYKPKDIVAGDFYWLENTEESILFAAADCTGHGVPGAMVSVFCNNGLNRSVRELNLREPGEILDKTREIVIQEFDKSDENVNDGMDIAMCSLRKVPNEKGEYLLQYAGAHNPLWIIRKNATEIEEIKANKEPIGKFHHQSPFTTHTLSMEKGDMIYIFSDGYQDQFGGEKGKKFKAKNLKALLLANQHKSPSEQKDVLDEAFEQWRGTLEQLDDVCVIGVRL